MIYNPMTAAFRSPHQPPIFGKIITNAIRNDSESDICLILHHIVSHNTINSIIDRPVSTDTTTSSITIISQGTANVFTDPKPSDDA